MDEKVSGLRVLVCGGRNFADRAMLNSWMARAHDKLSISLVIEGGARGADTLAKQFAQERGIPIKTFAADWKKHGRAAGPIRNRQMLTEGKPDMVIAFPGGNGTADMVKAAREAGVKVVRLPPPTASDR